MSTFVGLNTLVEDTGETPRTLQHWTDLGILRAEEPKVKKGRGYHRLYRAEAPKYGERTWALIASELNRARLPLADMKRAIDRLRKGFSEPLSTPDGKIYALDRHPVGRALMGRFVMMLMVFDGDDRFQWTTVLDTESVDHVEPHTVWKAGDLGAEQKEDWKVFDNVSLKVPLDILRGHKFTFLLNLTGVLAPLRILDKRED